MFNRVYSKFAFLFTTLLVFASNVSAQAVVPDLSGTLPTAADLQTIVIDVAPTVVALVVAVIAVKVTIRLLNRGGGK